jgi:DNA-binding MarR family transcriptional regulator
MKKPTMLDDEHLCGYPETLIACPDFLLGTVSVTVAELLEEALEPLGIRLRHYRLLRVLAYEGPQQQSALGATLQVDRTTVVALVDFLEENQLANRVRDPGDRRAYVVRLTEKGQDLARQASTAAAAIQERIFAPLASTERSTLRALFTRLLTSPGPIADAHARIIPTET